MAVHTTFVATIAELTCMKLPFLLNFAEPFPVESAFLLPVHNNVSS